MAVITPTLTLTSNANTHTPADAAGPLSVALSLTATDTLTIAGHVESKIHNFTGAAVEVILFDGATATYGNNTETAGTVGAYLYFRNTGATGDVYIGVGADDDVAQDIDGTNDGASYDDNTANATRLFTLRPGEFAWMPYDYALRIFGDASAAATLEYWLFDKA
tara:strand:+ start:69 stop:560 length:492 start_codon:yes stop_codon:yes gene_type:complete